MADDSSDSPSLRFIDIRAISSRLARNCFDEAPVGATDGSQGWSEAEPLESSHPWFGAPVGAKDAVAPTGALFRCRQLIQGFRFAPPLATICRPYRGLKKSGNRWEAGGACSAGSACFYNTFLDRNFKTCKRGYRLSLAHASG
jgi:hypothetical protein